MNVNIIINKNNSILEGYENISDRFFEDEKIKKVESIINLDEVCDDGELKELRAYEVIEWLPDEKLEDAIKCWMKKVSIGGYLTISSTDMYELAYLIVHGQLEIHNASNILYGGKNNCFSAEQMVKYFRENNFSIERVIKENLRFSVRGKKNA